MAAQSHASIPQLYELFVSKSLEKMKNNSDFSGSIIEENQIIQGLKIGAGSFKSVYRAEFHNEPVALVKFHGITDTLNEDEKRLIRREISHMQKIGNHANIVRLVGLTTNFNVVMELCSKSLFEFLLDPKRSLDLSQRFEVLFGVLKGIKYIHSIGYAHQDLKPHNILISTDEKTPKLADFGSTRALYASSVQSSRSSISGGTHGFQGPEIHLDEEVEQKCDPRMGDIYATGGLLIFIFSGKLPFQSFSEAAGANREKRQFSNLLKAWQAKSPYYPEPELTAVQENFTSKGFEKIGSGMVVLIRQCMSTDPRTRPVITDLYRSAKALFNELAQSNPQLVLKTQNSELPQRDNYILLKELLENELEQIHLKINGLYEINK
jgi:serine/threonine protein kinase